MVDILISVAAIVLNITAGLILINAIWIVPPSWFWAEWVSRIIITRSCSVRVIAWISKLLTFVNIPYIHIRAAVAAVPPALGA